MLGESSDPLAAGSMHCGPYGRSCDCVNHNLNS